MKSPKAFVATPNCVRFGHYGHDATSDAQITLIESVDCEASFRIIVHPLMTQIRSVLP